LDTTHNHDIVEQTMEILHIERKGKMLNALESYHIYKLAEQRLQMNEAVTDNYNPIYDVLIKTNSNTRNPTHFSIFYPPPPPSTTLAPASPILFSFPCHPHPMK
jgi:hypothetical protein